MAHDSYASQIKPVVKGASESRIECPELIEQELDISGSLGAGTLDGIYVDMQCAGKQITSEFRDHQPAIRKFNCGTFVRVGNGSCDIASACQFFKNKRAVGQHSGIAM